MGKTKNLEVTHPKVPSTRGRKIFLSTLICPCPQSVRANDKLDA